MTATPHLYRSDQLTTVHVLQFAETIKPDNIVITVDSVLLRSDFSFVPTDNSPEAENNVISLVVYIH